MADSRTRTENTMTANGSEVMTSALNIPFLHHNNLGFSVEHLPGKRHGRGEYRYADGTKYIGNWDNDRIQGEGICLYPNGNK